MIRIVVLPFSNSAKLSEFDIIPDGSYSRFAYSSAIDTETHPHTKQNIEEPMNVLSGEVARETTLTFLHQTSRFEIVPLGIYRSKLREMEKGMPGDPLNSLKAARQLNIQYLVRGDLSNFEIRENKNYWHMPLWVLLLIGALFIKNDDYRRLALEIIVRMLFYAPLNSFIWKKGLGWRNIELQVDVGMSMRFVDVNTGNVVFAENKDITRTETVRNLNLLLWESNSRIKITRSNAGRQIRFASYYLVQDVIEWIDESN